METASKPRKAVEENVLREFPAIGRYRVRLVRKAEKTPQLDIREFIENERFTGFTRKGVRLTGRPEWEQLLAALRDAVDLAAMPPS